ncbi:MAG: helix-turn-helix domain-containing protein [Telluria sp.]
MSTSILSVLFVMAIGQGLFLAAVLPGKRQPAGARRANRLLSGLLLVSVGVIGHAWLGMNELYGEYPHSALAVMPLGLLVGPLLYLYLGALLFDRPVGRRQLLHFLPFALVTLAMLPFYLQGAEAKLAWMLGRTGPRWELGLAAVAKLLIFLAYVGACYRLIRRAGSGPHSQGLRWLLGAWLTGGLLSVAALAMEFADAPLGVSSDAAGGLALMCFVYATAYFALRLPAGYQARAEPPAQAIAAAPAPKARYARTLLSADDRERFLARLTFTMETRELFRNGELTLEALALAVAMTPHELSQLINDACRANFQEYLNRYRVQALCQALSCPRYAGETILDLALASGFNSKSALNRAFRKHTGMTPGEYRKQAGNPEKGSDSSFATQ